MMIYNFAQTIIDQSYNYPNKIAMHDGVDSLTYQQLGTRIKQVSKGLKSLGLTKGSHIIITMEDCIDWPVTFLACVYSGIVPLPLSTSLGIELFYKISKFIDCEYIIAGNSIDLQKTSIPICRRNDIQRFFLLEEEDQPADVHPDGPAYMNMSSGSTGMPKIAMHRHQTLFEILELGPKINFSMDSNSIILSVPKMSWNFGLHNSVTYALGLGATAVVIPDAPAAPTIFDYITKFRPTIVVCSPSIIKRLLKTPSKYLLPDSILHFHSSGEHLPRPMYDQFLKRFGLKINCCIGMMETCTTYSSNPDYDHDPCTVGKVLPGCKIKFIDNEIYVSSPANACYYYKNYELTKQTFIGEWVKTGDCGYINDQGNLVFTGRVDDSFKVNDLIVNPVEIESVMIQYQDIDQVAVAGVLNANQTKEVHAFVMPNDGFELENFKNFLKENLFPHQIPKQIHLIEQLPETITNKKDRRTLAKNLCY